MRPDTVGSYHDAAGIRHEVLWRKSRAQNGRIAEAAESAS